MDRIVVRDLKVRTRTGVTDAERSEPQTVVVNIEAMLDLRAAGRSDELSDTLDYGAVAVEVARLAAASETRLLESLAEKIAARIATMKPLEKVSVEVTKPSPPIDEDVGPVGVRIERP